MRKIKNNIPEKIYMFFLLLVVAFCIIGIPIFSIGHSSGEQVPFTLFVIVLSITQYGLFAISVITSILYFEWAKKYWFINGTIIIIGVASILIDVFHFLD